MKTLFFSLPVVLFSALVGTATAEPVPTVNDIISGIKASESRFFQLDSFLVNCERKKSEDVTPSRYGGGYINVEYVVAKSGNRWFTSKTFTEIGQKNSDGLNIVGGVYTPLEPTITLQKNHLSLEWSQSSNNASLDRAGEGLTANVHSRFDYFRYVGWNASRHFVESENQNYDVVQKDLFGDDVDHPFLPEFLEKNKGKYTVHPTQEEVDGFPCWVVEYPGMDKFWIDTDYGYAVRKRIYHWEPGKARKYGIHNQEWKEVAPELWLPHKQIVDRYAGITAEEPAIWDKVTARFYYEINEIRINDVPEEVFEITLPIGLQVIDTARDTIYTVWEEGHDPFVGFIEHGVKPNRFVVFRAITIIIGSILIFIAVWRMLRRTEGT